MSYISHTTTARYLAERLLYSTHKIDLDSQRGKLWGWGWAYGANPTSITSSFKLVVVSWILICRSFISWELTSPDWCLFKLGPGQGYLGNHTIDFGLFVLLALWRLCVSFNGIHQFNSPFNNYCFTIHRRLQYLKGVFLCVVVCFSFFFFSLSLSPQGCL